MGWRAEKSAGEMNLKLFEGGAKRQSVPWTIGKNRLLKCVQMLLGERTDNAGRIPCGNHVRGYITGDDAPCTDYCSAPNAYTGADDGAAPHPYIRSNGDRLCRFEPLDIFIREIKWFFLRVSSFQTRKKGHFILRGSGPFHSSRVSEPPYSVISNFGGHQIPALFSA